MYWRDSVKLCAEAVSYDKFNRPQKSGYTKRTVNCDVKGVKRTEFYQAQAAGYKPEITVEVKQIDYERERYLEHNGVMYKIIRTYPVKNECLELICEGFSGDE